MNINWTVRLKNKYFWLSIIPAILLLVSQVLAVLRISIDTSLLSEQLTGIVGTVFSIFALLGIVNDPTTDGTSDSARALTYNAPIKSGKEDIYG